VAHLTDTQEEFMSTPASAIRPQNNGESENNETATHEIDEAKQALFYIRESILREFKKRAIDEGKTFSRLAEDVIQDYLRKPKLRD
jgi:hypothetical protein